MIKEIHSLPKFRLIKTNQQLAEVCQQARQQTVVALDTEFVRTRSYYPKLGLIQLYDGNQVSLIDPLDIDDIAPFIELLRDQNVLKVLHACYEDLEVFQHYFEHLPTPMLDTQVMAMFLGFEQSTGLAKLAKHYFNLELDKESARTDWLARPLTEKQLYYAAADVWYLFPLYQQLAQALSQTPWQDAAQFDCNLLLEKRLQPKLAEKAYKQIGNAWKLAPVELARLQILAKWRQEEAIKRDLALNFVVKGENLWAIAKHNPKNSSQLLELGLTTQEVRIHGKKMLQLVEQVKRLSEQDYPSQLEPINLVKGYKSAFKKLQQRLREIAPTDLKAEVIATRRDLDSLIKWCWREQKNAQKLPILMRNWRQPFGEQLVNCLEQFDFCQNEQLEDREE